MNETLKFRWKVDLKKNLEGGDNVAGDLKDVAQFQFRVFRMRIVGWENEKIRIASGHGSSGDAMKRKLEHRVVQDRFPVTGATVELLGGDAEEH